MDNGAAGRFSPDPIYPWTPAQLHLMKEEPGDIDAALELAVNHEVVESAQKRLHKEKKRVGAERLTVTEDSGVVNTVARDAKIDELTKKVHELSEEISHMQGAQSQGDSGPPVIGDKADVICWGCRGCGQIRRNCPQRGQQSNSRRYGRPTCPGINTAAVNAFFVC